jgi:restriction system protein
VVDSTHAWRLRAWGDPALERRWLLDGIVTMSADEIGDLTTWPGEAEVSRRLASAPTLRERSKAAVGIFVTYWRYFRLEVQLGDLIFVPTAGGTVAMARVEGPYEYSADEHDSLLRHRRRVRWMWHRLPRSSLPEPLRRVVNAPGTICRVDPHRLEGLHLD